MEEMFAGFASDRKAAGVVGTRIQSALDRFTDRYVFILNALAHLNTGMVPSASLVTHNIRKVEIKNYFRLVHSARDHEIRVHHTVVPVDHEVWMNPVIQRALAFPHRASLSFGAFSNDRAPLQTIAFPVFDHVITVIEHTVKAFVQVRHVIAAVKIVVDKNFPVAIKTVMPPLEPMQVVQLKSGHLLNEVLAQEIN